MALHPAAPRISGPHSHCGISAASAPAPAPTDGHALHHTTQRGGHSPFWLHSERGVCRTARSRHANSRALPQIADLLCALPADACTRPARQGSRRPLGFDKLGLDRSDALACAHGQAQLAHVRLR